MTRSFVKKDANKVFEIVRVDGDYRYKFKIIIMNDGQLSRRLVGYDSLPASQRLAIRSATTGHLI